MDDEAVAESLKDPPDEGAPKKWSDGMEDVMAGIGRMRFSRDMRVQEVSCKRFLLRECIITKRFDFNSFEFPVRC